MKFGDIFRAIGSFITNDILPAVGTFAKSRIFPAIILLVLGILIIRLIMRIAKSTLSHLDPSFTKLLFAVIRPFMYAILGLVVTASLGIDVTSLVALASVLTLAISLSLQNALGNVFGGFTLLYTKPFHVDDYVEIAGQGGTVKEVGLAYTRLATPDNRLIYIPNSAVVAAEIVNYTATGSRRLDFPVNVPYSTDAETVIAALLEVAAMEPALEDPAPAAVVSEYGAGYVTYTLRIWTKTDDFWPTKFDLGKKVKEVFTQKGIEISYSHMNVHVIQ